MDQKKKQPSVIGQRLMYFDVIQAWMRTRALFKKLCMLTPSPFFSVALPGYHVISASINKSNVWNWMENLRSGV